MEPFHLKSFVVIAALVSTIIHPTRSSDSETAQRPHIIIITADDMGSHDVGFHGSNQIPTPNIDALAYDGIILNRHYTAPMCTPSRASLMTGKNPISIGMQHYVIDSDEPWGLGLDQKIMPEYFKEAGYRTHLIGKWHLGLFERQYTPTQRGFDTHTGFLGPYIDYWHYNLKMAAPKNYDGYDMRNNLEVDWNSNGTYATDHFTKAATSIIENHDPAEPLLMVVNHLAPHAANADDPLQAPEETVKKFEHISDEKRRVYAAMVSKLDDSIGEVFNSLRSKNMLENSIIVFLSDNGAPSVGMHSNTGSNYPLRGIKNSPWEGSTRNAALIWSPRLEKRQRVSNQFIHISDWLPTLASAAGIETPFSSEDHSEIDGLDQWEALSYDTGNPRRVVLNMIDPIFGYSSYMENGFKYINGTTLGGQYDEWYGQLNSSDPTISEDDYVQRILETDVARWLGDSLSKDTIKYLRKNARVNCGQQPVINTCNPLVRPCLFDIINDPCELNDLSRKHHLRMRELRVAVATYGRLAAKPRNKPDDPAANPANFGGIWTWWRPDTSRQDLEESNSIREGPEIPPPHSSLPENVQLIVTITITVVGVLFVAGALIYLSNKNVLRLCRFNRAKGDSTVPVTNLSQSESSSSDGKLSDVFVQPPQSVQNASSSSSTIRTNPKVYHISDNSLSRY